MIHSKYRVERVIGEGGMGVVLAAKHLTLDRSVAIKVLSAKAQENSEALERFTREARAAARIQSEHVGKVLDVDALPGGAPFIVMELLEGHDLAEEVRRQGRLPFDPAISMILQACEAVAEAHAAGIVHRDLKPANLFLSKTATGSASIKVLDFGISKITRREEAASTTDEKALTNAGSMLGSPLYMSPEQMRGSTEVDGRTDVWSLGVILYELITGRSPFDARTIPMICAAVLAQTPDPLDVPGAPEELERVILRCLEKDVANRYRDVAHLVRALAPFAPEQAKITLERVTKLRDENGMPGASPATVPPPPDPNLSKGSRHKEGSLTITSWGEKAPPAAKRRWWPLAIAGGVSLVVLAFVLQGVLSEKASETSAVPTTSASTVVAAVPVVATDDPSTTTSAPATSVLDLDVTTSQPSSSASASGPAAHPRFPRPTSGRPGDRAPTSKSGRTVGFGGRE